MPPDHVLILRNDPAEIEGAVDRLTDVARHFSFSRDRLRLNFRVGLTEALTNAMLYGNCGDPKKRVRVAASFSHDEIRVEVTDEGHGFDPGALSDPTLPANRARPGGRGVFLIRQLMDQVEFNDRGNSITMVLYNQGEASNEAPPEPATG